MEIIKIEKDSLRAIIHDDLRKKIVTGEILPERLLTTRFLAEQFGVSIIPVREALMQLQKEGIIKLNKKGFQFNTPSIDEFKEIYYIRSLLEPEIAKTSCKGRPDSAVTELEQYYVEMKNARDPRLYNVKNHEFHFFIYTFANSPLLLNFIDNLWARIGPYLYMASTNENVRRGMEIHRTMLDAFRSSNSKQMMVSVRSDLKLSFHSIKPLIEFQTAERKH
jgi:DNA-binding GntR family transcriptional regulator